MKTNLAEMLSAAAAPRMSPFTRWGVKDADLTTALPPGQEQAFRSWVGANNVPFNPDARGPTDYDMRGFYRGLMAGDPRAQTAVNPNDNRMHYPDAWKTPYHESFSAESQFAGPDAPAWNSQDQLITPQGTKVFDERAGGVPLLWRNR